MKNYFAATFTVACILITLTTASCSSSNGSVIKTTDASPRHGSTNGPTVNSSSTDSSINPSGEFIKGAPPSKALIVERSKLTEQVIKPWVDSVNEIAKVTKDSNIQVAVDILNNHCVSAPMNYQDLPASQVLTEPKNLNKSGICFTVITEKDKQDIPAWKEKLDRENFTASYGLNSIAVEQSRSEQMKNKYLRGLVMLHELQHWKQDVVDGIVGKAPHGFIEADAYEFELSVLDQLKLPGYDEFIKTEVAKMDISTNKLVNPFLNDPRVGAMFGPMNPDFEQKLASTLLWFRVLFKKYDQDPKTANARKNSIMSAIYGG